MSSILNELKDLEIEISNLTKLTSRTRRKYDRILSTYKKISNNDNDNIISNKIFHINELLNDKELELKNNLIKNNTSYSTKETDETLLLNDNNLLSHQTTIKQQQDDKLSHMLAGVTNIKTMSLDMHEELNLHQNLLQQIDEDVDRNDYKIQINMDGIDNMQSAKTGWCPLFTMIILLFFIGFSTVSNAPCAIFG